MLHRTTVYRVHVENGLKQEAALLFVVEPTGDLIVEALETERPEPPSLPLRKVYAGSNADAMKTYERACKRVDNLKALVRLAEIKIPAVDENTRSPILTAGVHIGHVNIHADAAWTDGI